MSDERTLEQALIALRDERERIAHGGSAAFQRQLAALRHWQSERVAAHHRARAEQHDGEALLHFLTRTFYLEADWSELIGQPDVIAARIGRIIRDDRPLVVAVELQSSAERLDAAMADVLLEDDDAPDITAPRYVSAFRRVGAHDLRSQQIAWVGELVDLLGGYADNRAAYWAFKLAGKPAKALGMAHTYALLAEGFAAMRNTEDLETATRAAVADQRRLLERLLGNTPT